MNLGLLLIHVEPGSKDTPLRERIGQSTLVYDGPARGIDEHRLGFHLFQFPSPYEVPGLLRKRGMQGDEVRGLKQLVELCIPRPELVLRILFTRSGGVEDLHIKASRAAGHRLPNPPET